MKAGEPVGVLEGCGAITVVMIDSQAGESSEQLIGVLWVCNVPSNVFKTQSRINTHKPNHILI